MCSWKDKSGIQNPYRVCHAMGWAGDRAAVPNSEPILGLGLPPGLRGLGPVIPQLQLARLGLVGQPHQLVLAFLHP